MQAVQAVPWVACLGFGCFSVLVLLLLFLPAADIIHVYLSERLL